MSDTSEKVLITGATGLIGRHLTPLLIREGYDVVHLSRTPSSRGNVRTYSWDPLKGELDDTVLEEGIDHIIHLAGASIADGRWTSRYKELLLDSRVKSAALLYDRFGKTGNIKTFISASGVNYYGTRTTNQVFSEEDPPADDFLGKVCVEWERAADRFSEQARVVKIRTGVVLEKEDGALPQLAFPVRWLVGAPLGSGEQYIPWIHIDDICRVYLKGLQDEAMMGAYNAVAPDHVTNKIFIKTLGKVLKRPVILPPVPGFLLKLVLGEKADLILEGSRMSCSKLEQQGFAFRYDQLVKALEAIYK